MPARWTSTWAGGACWTGSSITGPSPPQTLAAGDTTRIDLRPPVQLGSKGGLITLVNTDGLKVDGVAYTQDQADREGWTIDF